jgi:hypothetical protein
MHPITALMLADDRRTELLREAAARHAARQSRVVNAPAATRSRRRATRPSDGPRSLDLAITPVRATLPRS